MLYVAEGATTTFMGVAEFSNNSISIKLLEPIYCGDNCGTVVYVTKKGCAVHNKVQECGCIA